MHNGRECLRRTLVRDIQVLTSGGRRGGDGGAPGGRRGAAGGAWPVCSCRRGATSGDAPRAQHSGRILTTQCDSSTRSFSLGAPTAAPVPEPQSQPSAHSHSPGVIGPALGPVAHSPTSRARAAAVQPWSPGTLGQRPPLGPGAQSAAIYPGPQKAQSSAENL